MIRMLKTLIGPEAFRTGMDLYFERCDGTAATVEEFLTCFADVSGRDLTTSSAGTLRPARRGSRSANYDERSGPFASNSPSRWRRRPARRRSCRRPCRSRSASSIREAATCPWSRPTRAPVSSPPASSRWRTSERAIAFHDVPRRPALSFLRGFSAPVKVDDDLTEDDLIVCWRATATLSTAGRRCRPWRRAAAASRDGDPRRRAPERTRAHRGFRRIDRGRARRPHRPGLRGVRNDVPSEADIAREIGGGRRSGRDPRAREALRGALGRTHAAALTTLHAAWPTPGRSAPMPRAPAGARCVTARLAMIVSGDAIEGADLATAQSAKPTT